MNVPTILIASILLISLKAHAEQPEQLDYIPCFLAQNRVYIFAWVA